MNTLDYGEKLEFNQFVEYIKDNMFLNDPEMAGRVELTVNEVTKNNGVHLTGITIKLDDNAVCPTIYLNNAYDDYTNGHNLQYCLARLRRSYWESGMENSMDMSFFESFDTVKNKLAFRVINTEMNTETLPDMPFFSYGDLSVTFVVDILDKERNVSGFVRVLNQHMDMWHVTHEELFNAALKRECEEKHYKIESMLEVISGENYDEVREDLLEDEDYSEALLKADNFMHVVTTEDCRYGASAIMRADILEEHAKMIGESFYILPSSIHELILMTGSVSDKMYADKLIDTVKQINEERLDPEEVLANNVYFYDKDEKQIYRLDTKEAMYLKCPAAPSKYMFHGSDLKNVSKESIKEKMASYKITVESTPVINKKDNKDITRG